MSKKVETAAVTCPTSSCTGAALIRNQQRVLSLRTYSTSCPVTDSPRTALTSGHSSAATGRPLGWNPFHAP
jgi:hypothetical protein